MVAPTGTPAEIITKLNAAINAALKSPAMQTAMERLGVESRPGTPSDFHAFIAEELPKWQKVIQESGLKLQ